MSLVFPAVITRLERLLWLTAYPDVEHRVLIYFSLTAVMAKMLLQSWITFFFQFQFFELPQSPEDMGYRRNQIDRTSLQNTGESQA